MPWQARIADAEAADGLRSIGLGVSEINEIQGQATKDLGFPVAGQAMGYGDMFSKMLNQNDQYEIAEGYYNDMGVMAARQSVATARDQETQGLGQGHQSHQDRKAHAGVERRAGRCPLQLIWCDADGTIEGAVGLHHYGPAWHNADSLGYNPKATGRPIESWGELLNKDFKGKVALINVPQIGVMDAALAIEGLGLKKFVDKGNMTKAEIDFLIDYLIPLKKAGHFRAFWENFGQSVNLMVNGEVALESMWSPAVAAIQAESVPCVYAFPKEGMRGWHGGLAISAKVKGKQLDQAYEYINWWLAGWPAAFVARQGYYHSVPETRRSISTPTSGTIGIWASRRPRICPIRSALSSSRRATFDRAALIGAAIRRSPSGIR